MDGRKRTIQIKFRVTEAERDLILEKMKLVPTRNMEAYLRKIAIDGYIIQVDHSDIKAMTAEIQKIGVNINQIARRLNEEAKAGRLRGTEAAQFLKLSTALTNRMEHVVGKVGNLIKASRARCKLVEVARENQP